MDKFIQWVGVDYFMQVATAIHNGYEFDPIDRLDLSIIDELDGVEFGLSKQAKKALTKANIETLRDLTQYSRKELSEIQGLSKVCAYRIVMGLRDYQLKLRDD